MTNISAKDVVIRKPHKCWGCAREFPVGATLNRLVNVDGGEIYTTYWCPVCDEYFSTNCEYDDEGIEFGFFAGEDDWKRLRATMEPATLDPVFSIISDLIDFQVEINLAYGKNSTWQRINEIIKKNAR